ncbi:MAG: hypothetical protein WEA24_16585, partial [Gemmatimonadota bacterium]
GGENPGGGREWPQPGLCAGCDHARVVATRTGSRFWLCGLSRDDERFPRYPRLPVLRCAGFTAGTPSDAAADAGS